MPDLCRVEFAARPSSMRQQSVLNGWRLEYVAVDIGAAPRRAVVALHGFARPLEDHLIWREHWPEDARLISIHLMHHGGSGPADPDLPADAAIPPATLLAHIQDIVRQEGCDPEDMDLIGYSIGGRIAMTLLVEAPDVWGQILLLAPDGFRKAPLYDLTVHTRLGRFLWQALDRHAAGVNAVVTRLGRWGIMPKHLVQFALFHTETRAMREMVWRGWRAHRLCWPATREVARAMAGRRHGRVDLVFGLKDRVIPVSNAARLKRLLAAWQPESVHFHELLCGHGMLRSDILSDLEKRIFGA